MTDLSLVVIGKNDIINLKKIYTEKYLSSLREQFKELIYVDSFSKDESVDFMKKLGFDVYIISSLSYKCASYGRFIGAKEATSKYVLFLDSDMKINNLNILSTELLFIKNNFIGLVGDVIDFYPTGKKRVRVRKKTEDNSAISFGGFILFDRNKLIEVGNWDPFIPANEELELHTRVIKYNYKIYKSNSISVDHFTVVPSSLYELMSLYFPLRKQRYGAFGYVLNATIRKKNIHNLIKLSPEPFELLFSLLILILTKSFFLFSFIFLIFTFKLIKNRSFKYLVVPPGILISTIYGLFKYKKRNGSYEKI